MLSKKMQTHSNRIKPKAHKEPDYMQWLHNNLRPPCFVCNISIGIQIHHIKEHSNDKRNDNEIIALCYNHHLGHEFSVHNNPKEFKEQFPMEVQLKHAKKMYQAYKDSK